MEGNDLSSSFEKDERNDSQNETFYDAPEIIDLNKPETEEEIKMIREETAKIKKIVTNYAEGIKKVLEEPEISLSITYVYEEPKELSWERKCVYYAASFSGEKKNRKVIQGFMFVFCLSGSSPYYNPIVFYQLLDSSEKNQKEMVPKNGINEFLKSNRTNQSLGCFYLFEDDKEWIRCPLEIHVLTSLFQCESNEATKKLIQMIQQSIDLSNLRNKKKPITKSNEIAPPSDLLALSQNNDRTSLKMFEVFGEMIKSHQTISQTLIRQTEIITTTFKETSESVVKNLSSLVEKISAPQAEQSPPKKLSPKKEPVKNPAPTKMFILKLKCNQQDNRFLKFFLMDDSNKEIGWSIKYAQQENLIEEHVENEKRSYQFSQKDSKRKDTLNHLDGLSVVVATFDDLKDETLIKSVENREVDQLFNKRKYSLTFKQIVVKRVRSIYLRVEYHSNQPEITFPKEKIPYVLCKIIKHDENEVVDTSNCIPKKPNWIQTSDQKYEFLTFVPLGDFLDAQLKSPTPNHNQQNKLRGIPNKTKEKRSLETTSSNSQKKAKNL